LLMQTLLWHMSKERKMLEYLAMLSVVNTLLLAIILLKNGVDKK
jgi:hypothetical protein